MSRRKNIFDTILEDIAERIPAIMGYVIISLIIFPYQPVVSEFEIEVEDKVEFRFPIYKDKTEIELEFLSTEGCVFFSLEPNSIIGVGWRNTESREYRKITFSISNASSIKFKSFSGNGMVRFRLTSNYE